MTAETELLACKCGRRGLPQVFPSIALNGHVQVRCVCGMETRFFPNRAAAVNCWNTCATLALPEERESLISWLRSLDCGAIGNLTIWRRDVARIIAALEAPAPVASLPDEEAVERIVAIIQPILFARHAEEQDTTAAARECAKALTSAKGNQSFPFLGQPLSVDFGSEGNRSQNASISPTDGLREALEKGADVARELLIRTYRGMQKVLTGQPGAFETLEAIIISLEDRADFSKAVAEIAARSYPALRASPTGVTEEER